MRLPLRSDEGVSLAEVLVGLLLLGILGGVTEVMVGSAYRAERYSNGDFLGLSDTRVVVDRMSKELRQARQVLAGSDASHLQFWIDLNRNGVTDPGEVVTYAAATATLPSGVATVELKRSVNGSPGSQLLASTLTTTAVFAYDAPPPGTSIVTITLRAGTTTKDSPVPRTVSTQVDLRNR